MLEATKAGVWKSRYDITMDGRPITTWDPSVWKTGGTFVLDRRSFDVRANLWGSRYSLVRDDGRLIASADGVGRKRWTVEADGRTYEFQRASLRRREEELRVGSRRAGLINRPSMWRSDTVADLPGLPLPVQIFALAVVITKWDSAAAAGSTGSSGSWAAPTSGG